MTESHPEVFFPRLSAEWAGETFPLPVCRVNPFTRSAIYRSISKLFDIDLAVLTARD
jgi:hypothetical protein